MNKKIFIAILVVSILVLAACDLGTQIPVENETLNVTLPVNRTNETVSNDTQDLPFDPDRAAFRVTATEGELVRIPVDAYDPDGGEVTLSFSEPFNEEGLWLTEIGDEGKYLVRVSATDGMLTTMEYVLVEILRANRPPVVECPEEIRVSEGELVNINCNIYDEDGDPVIVSYEGWMRTSTYQTDFGDAGNHSVLVRARDRHDETVAEVRVIVDKTNRPPVITPIQDMEVSETETFTVPVEAYDPDGDDVEISFSEPLDEAGSWTPDFGDRGTYNITVTATDGIDTVTETFTLTVLAENRPPVLEPIQPITVREGELVEIPVQAYDPDGDDLIISFSGWMDSATYQTTHDDAYPDGCDEPGCTATYYVNVSVSDGVLETSQMVEINVVDRNRPPVFIWGED